MLPIASAFPTPISIKNVIKNILVVVKKNDKKTAYMQHDALVRLISKLTVNRIIDSNTGLELTRGSDPHQRNPNNRIRMMKSD